MLTYGWTQTSGAAVTLSDSGAPAPTFTASTTGTLTFQLTVTDTGDLSDSDTTVVTITTEAINHAPQFTSAPVTTAVVGITYTYTATATDVDGDTLTITATTKPDWLALSDYGEGVATLRGTPLAPGEVLIELSPYTSRRVSR